MDLSIAVKPDDDFDHWHQVTCRHYSLTECRPIRNDVFRASVTMRSFGALKMSEISSVVDERERLRVVRSPVDVRRDSRDDFILWLSVAGRTFLEQDGRAAELRPGDLMLYDQARPFSLEFGARSHSIIVTIPRPLLTARLFNAEKLVARRIASGSALTTLARSIAAQYMHCEPGLKEDVESRLAGGGLEIWSAMLVSELSAESTDQARPRARLEQAKRYMLAQLANPDLAIDTIAASQHISVRTLVRLFAIDGETPMRWLWKQRVAASYRMLAEHRVARVSDAALACGFSDMSHFSRTFVTTFGLTPRQVLRDGSKD